MKLPIPSAVRSLLRRYDPSSALETARLARSLAQSAHDRITTGSGPQDAPDGFPLQPWWEQSFWEPTVALAIRDYCRPGGVVFDVGTNAGGLAMMMSRLVGPRGIVLAFEASPRIIAKTQHNLVKAGCNNVTLFHRAIWNKTGETVMMAAGTHLNDRIEAGTQGMPVRTLALDDLARAGDFRPSFIKMDIEGAEFDALHGMEWLLREVRPVMVLEQAPEDTRCLELLTQAGYAAMDLASYWRITGAADFSPGVGVANLLFAPQEAISDSPYFSTAQPEAIMSLAPDQFVTGADGVIRFAPAIRLPAGRYILRSGMTAEGTDNEAFAGVEVNGAPVFRYHSYTKFLANSYSDWVFQLERESLVTPYVQFLRGGDSTLEFRSAVIVRLPAFDNVAEPVLQ
jgi:FkbM family methyltransferase